MTALNLMLLDEHELLIIKQINTNKQTMQSKSYPNNPLSIGLSLLALNSFSHYLSNIVLCLSYKSLYFY